VEARVCLVRVRVGVRVRVRVEVRVRVRVRVRGESLPSVAGVAVAALRGE